MMKMRSKLMQAPVITCLFFPAWAISDVVTDRAGAQLIERKAQLGYQMLAQINSTETAKLTQELKMLSGSKNEENLDQRLRMLDGLLATIANLYRQRHDRTELLAQQDKTRYKALHLEIESFKQSLEVESESDLSYELQKMSQRFYINFDNAEKIASRGDYTQALPIIERAKHQIVLIVTSLNQSRTVDYKLEFESISDEFDYEIRRFTSQMMIIELTMHERPLTSEVTERVEESLNIARAMHKEAQLLADSARYQAALDKQESAVGELNSILRLMGYFF